MTITIPGQVDKSQYRKDLENAVDNLRALGLKGDVVLPLGFKITEKGSIRDKTGLIVFGLLDWTARENAKMLISALEIFVEASLEADRVQALKNKMITR